VIEQGVALTGPPCSVSRPTAYAPGGWPARTPAVLQTTTLDDRRPRAKQYWPIRRASNKREIRTGSEWYRVQGSAGIPTVSLHCQHVIFLWTSFVKDCQNKLMSISPGRPTSASCPLDCLHSLALHLYSP